MPIAPILLAGQWRTSDSSSTFTATNPATGQPLPAQFPVSSWDDIDTALTASAEAATTLRHADPEQLATFLETYAANLEVNADALCALANQETGLPITPRLSAVELPRTTTQLRQGAAAAREGSWTQAVLDTKANIRSHHAPLGPIVVFGPNNFPFAFNGVSGGDLTAAIAAGNPVLAKAHPLHPGTSQLLAQAAVAALATAGLPPATLQMLYHFSNEDGLRLVADPRVGATSFTGSRTAGLALKAAADRAGKPIYLELSSLNPVLLLPGALAERGPQLATELADSCLAAAGQFCTSPNLILAIEGPDTEAFATALAHTLAARPISPLLSESGLHSLSAGVQSLIAAGATALTGAAPAAGSEGFRYKNTLLRTSAHQFFAEPEKLQHEAFGNATLLVIAKDAAELTRLVTTLEGNLTGSIYSSTTGADEQLYPAIAEPLRTRVGRLLNDKMPTGVALSPAMNHGGPFPSTGHPGFTAVGIPASMLRFTALHCYDNVRSSRLPAVLQDTCPNSRTWRTIDGNQVRG